MFRVLFFLALTGLLTLGPSVSEAKAANVTWTITVQRSSDGYALAGALVVIYDTQANVVFRGFTGFDGKVAASVPINGTYWVDVSDSPLYNPNSFWRLSTMDNDAFTVLLSQQ